MILLCMSTSSLKAADEELAADQAFMKELDIIKNPFDDGFPKAIVFTKKQVVIHEEPKKPKILPPKPRKLPPPVIKLPELNLQGVSVGDEINEAIIDDQNVSLLGTIKGAKLISVSKQGIKLLYKGKKFFLKIE